MDSEYSTRGSVTRARPVREITQFWLVLTLPWLLDLLGGRAILATAFGGLLWGMGVVLAAVRPRTKNQLVRNAQNRALTILSISWMTYWAYSFVVPPRRDAVLNAQSVQWLSWLHGGLLVAGLGMTFLLLGSAALWLVQNSTLRRSSWERRKITKKLPSLESLSNMCDRTVQLAFASWGLGLLLAIFTGLLSWKNQGHITLAWWSDIRVLTAALLWLLLAMAFQMSLFVGKERRWLYQAYLGLALSFIFLFTWSTWGTYSRVHEPLNWFI